MPEARWTNPSQPQTLQIAVFLLYATAFFFVLDTLRSGGIRVYFDVLPWGPLLIASAVAAVFAGRGIASETKIGYYLGLAVAIFPFAFRVLYTGSINALLNTDLVGLMFEIALVALLLHPQTRDYERIWFK
ncbi:MAG: hypothetical protein QOI20_1701 [Acidimicrobiaceae bacterium]|jgi:hypothetical protein|nr:hypothetical protein [Acidimicrobiaceae bacterium]